MPHKQAATCVLISLLFFCFKAIPGHTVWQLFLPSPIQMMLLISAPGLWEQELCVSLVFGWLCLTTTICCIFVELFLQMIITIPSYCLTVIFTFNRKICVIQRCLCKIISYWHFLTCTLLSSEICYIASKIKNCQWW